MIKQINHYKDKPLEVGKTYRTKLQTGERFTVTKDNFIRDKNGVIFSSTDTVFGVWENHLHLGNCPLSVERLIHEREEGIEKITYVCSKCGETINLD